MDPAKHDNISLGPSCNLGQSKRVADVVSDVLDLRDLVVVR